MKEYKSEFRLLKTLRPHLFFFWFRIFNFFTLYILVVTFETHKKLILETADYFIYIFQFNIFQLYIIAKSITHENIFGFYLSIAIMVNNAILAIHIPSTTSEMMEKHYFLISIIMCAAFLLEALFSSYEIIKNTAENNIRIFRKIGADEKINDAFTTRKCLETFIGTNVFLATVISGKVFLPPTNNFIRANLLIFGFMILTYIQQIFVSVNLHEESYLQRIIAIALSFLIIVTAIGVICVCSSGTSMEIGDKKSSAVLIHLFINIIIITVIMNYFLIKDTRQFGSGLKELLLFKTQKISLGEYK